MLVRSFTMKSRERLARDAMYTNAMHTRHVFRVGQNGCAHGGIFVTFFFCLFVSLSVFEQTRASRPRSCCECTLCSISTRKTRDAASFMASFDAFPNWCRLKTAERSPWLQWWQTLSHRVRVREYFWRASAASTWLVLGSPDRFVTTLQGDSDATAQCCDRCQLLRERRLCLWSPCKMVVMSLWPYLLSWRDHTITHMVTLQSSWHHHYVELWLFSDSTGPDSQFFDDVTMTQCCDVFQVWRGLTIRSLPTLQWFWRHMRQRFDVFSGLTGPVDQIFAYVAVILTSHEAVFWCFSGLTGPDDQIFAYVAVILTSPEAVFWCFFRSDRAWRSDLWWHWGACVGQAAAGWIRHGLLWAALSGTGETAAPALAIEIVPALVFCLPPRCLLLPKHYVVLVQ